MSLANRTRSRDPEVVLLAHSYLDDSGCRVWMGRPVPRYGHVSVAGKVWMVHRLAYTIWVGPIPEGHHVHHKCKNRLCIEPTHLEALTPREHVLGRHPEILAPAHAAAVAAAAQIQRAKTHCVHGHSLADAWIRPSNGQRHCRTCNRERQRRRRARAHGEGV